MTPEEISAACWGMRTRAAARAVTRAYNGRLKALNLQISQFALLVAVGQGEALSIERIADQLDLEPSAVLRNLKVLEARGLVVGQGGRGRRGRRLGLTPAGAELLEAATPVWARTQADLAGIMGVGADTVRTALAQLETAAQQLEGPRQ